MAPNGSKGNNYLPIDSCLPPLTFSETRDSVSDSLVKCGPAVNAVISI